MPMMPTPLPAVSIRVDAETPGRDEPEHRCGDGPVGNPFELRATTIRAVAVHHPQAGDHCEAHEREPGNVDRPGCGCVTHPGLVEQRRNGGEHEARRR